MPLRSLTFPATNGRCRSRACSRRTAAKASSTSSRSRLAAVVIAVLALSTAGGCGSTPPALDLPPPVITWHEAHFRGSPLSGRAPSAGAESALAQNGSEALDPQDAVHARVTAVALGTIPSDWGEPLSSRARLILANRGAEPLRSTLALAAGGRGALVPNPPELLAQIHAGELGPRAVLASFDLAVPPGVTANIEAIAGTADAARFAERPHGAGLAIHQSSAGDGPPTVEIALRVVGKLFETDDLSEAELDPDEEPPAVASGRWVPHQERIVLAPLAVGGDDAVLGCAVAIPSPFDALDSSEAIAWIVELTPVEAEKPEEFAAAFERCRTDLGTAAPSESAEPLLGRMSATEALARRKNRRAALAHVAASSGAPLASDVALAAPDDIVEEIANKATEGDEGDSLPLAEFGWRLESIAVTALADRLGEGDLTPALESLLSERAGEVGRRAALLKEVAGGSRSVSEFDRRLERENFILLEDSTPGARVRAYDWLARRGSTPKGYDPLASVKERRAALAAAIEAGEENAER